MGLFDALLSQEGVNLTGGGFVGAPDDKLMETRFDDMGNAYQVDVRMPLHQGHTKANSFNIPDNAQGLLQPEMPTESIDLGRQQVVQPSPQMMQPVPQSSFMPGSQESMAQNQQSTISPWSPEQTDYTDARNVMSGYKGGERLAQRDSGTFQDLTPNSDPSQAMEMLAMFKKEGKALTDLQFEKAMGSLGMSDVLAENRSQMNNFDESLNRLVNDNTNDFGEQVSADSFGQSDYDLNQQRQDTLDKLMMQDSVGERADNSMEQMYALNGTTPNVIPESEPEPTFTPDSKATDFWNEGAERDFNIKQNLGKVKEFGSDAIDTAGGILGPIAKSWYGNLTKDSERDVAEYNTDESLQGLMGQNVKRNIADMVKGGVDATMNPVETADAIASLVSGTVQHALPDDMAWNEESKDMASAVADIYAERYGSLEGFKKALAENPVEVIAELTGVGLVGKAGAAKLVSTLNNPDFLDKVESMSKAIDPTNLGPSSKMAEDYRMTHTSPQPEGKNSLDDFSETMPDSPNDPNFARYYGMGGEYSKADAETIAVMKTVQGNPDAEVTIYRAVPKGVKDINAGDWVSTSKDYANRHGDSHIEGGYDLIEKKVRAGDLNTDGDLHEWGYNPSKAEDGVLGQIGKKDDLSTQAQKYNSSEEWLRAGGPDIDSLDEMAFGFSEKSLKTLSPKDLNIKWKDDLENVEWEIEKSGKSETEWAKGVNLEEPIDVVFENGKFYVDDGHHRYTAAKILNKDLNIDLEIKDKPIAKITGTKDYNYDDFVRGLWDETNTKTDDGVLGQIGKEKAVAASGLLALGESQAQEKPKNGLLDGIKKPKIVRNVRSNNPGNIKDFGIKWNGMTGTESGGTVAEGEFVVFDKPENGIRALTRDLTNKRKRGLDTITKILNKYAPNGKENDTKSYIKDVARDVGIGATDKLSDKNMYKMIKAITKHEGGKESLKHFSDSIIKKGMKSAYKNKYQKFK
jgi:hypothetical protein